MCFGKEIQVLCLNLPFYGLENPGDLIWHDCWLFVCLIMLAELGNMTSWSVTFTRITAFQPQIMVYTQHPCTAFLIFQIFMNESQQCNTTLHHFF